MLNWHKHPDGITGPSSGDISEAIRDINVQCPGLETHPYTIAVRIQERQIASLSLDPKVCVLKKSDYGGEYSYAFRTYNMVFDGKNYTGLQQWDIKIE